MNVSTSHVCSITETYSLFRSNRNIILNILLLSTVYSTYVIYLQEFLVNYYRKFHTGRAHSGISKWPQCMYPHCQYHRSVTICLYRSAMLFCNTREGHYFFVTLLCIVCALLMVRNFHWLIDFTTPRNSTTSVIARNRGVSPPSLIYVS